MFKEGEKRKYSYNSLKKLTLNVFKPLKRRRHVNDRYLVIEIEGEGKCKHFKKIKKEF